MDKHESKYFHTAELMDEALILLLKKKDYQTITVKDICEKAGVNRSTFYLHYETIDDLLEENIESTIKKLLDKYQDRPKTDITGDINQLYLFTPEYLKPYLTFIKENKDLILLAYKKTVLFKTNPTLNKLNEKLFIPIMTRFNIPKDEQKYVISFFINGVHAIIKIWLENGCQESIDYMNDLIYKYIKR